MKYIIFLLISFGFVGCSTLSKGITKPETIVVKYKKNEYVEIGDSIMLLNSKGDTIAPMGKYRYYEESIPGNDIVIVLKESEGLIYVNAEGNELNYCPFIFDNGADYVSEGLVRIVDKDGKMGYVDSLHHVVIKPQFFFVEPWKDGYGRVAKEGYFERIDEEHKIVVVEKWYTIDRNGNLK